MEKQVRFAGIYDDRHDHDEKNRGIHIATFHYVENFKLTLTQEERRQVWYTGTDCEFFVRAWECEERRRKTTMAMMPPRKQRVVAKTKDWAAMANGILGIET